jgi:hypothetical protein
MSELLLGNLTGWEIIGPGLVLFDDEDRQLLWARKVADPYGITHEILVNLVEKDFSIRAHSEDRAPVQLVVQVTAPLELIAEMLRRSGYEVTRRPQEDE